MPGIFDQSTIYQVQQANDIVDVVAEHVSLKRKGREMVGLCPFHDDHTPSMNVSPSKQIFKCFACGAGGDVFKFVQMRENLTFGQAIERLAERAGIKLRPRRPRTGRPTDTRSQAPESVPEIDPNRLARLNAWAAEHFMKNLTDDAAGKGARDYLSQRQISPQSVRKWRIGLALGGGDALVDAARKRKIPLDLLAKAGLTTAAGQDRFVNRLVFTITDVTGRVIGFGGRTLDGSGPKYINSPATVLFDKSNCLFGLEQARHAIVASGTVVVVEGYTDVIMAHQLGCENVVATLGTSLTAGHGRMLRRFANKVIIVFDSDAAGIEAANRALEVCLSQRIDIKLASVPQGKDPCDFILAAGKEAFDGLLEGAVDVFKFKWDRLREKFAAEQSISARRAAVEEYLQAVAVGLSAGRVSAIETGLIVNQVSAVLGIDKKQINAELNTRMKRAARAASFGAENRKVLAVDLGQGLFAAAQRDVLEILLNEPRFYKSVESRIKPEDFDVPLLRQAAQVLFDLLENHTDPGLARVLANTESEQLATCITQLAQAGEQKPNSEQRLEDALKVFARQAVLREKQRIAEAKDQTEYLRRLYEGTPKSNPHNVGMT